MKFRHKLEPYYLIALILIIWQILSTSGLIPAYMLPSPYRVIQAFCSDFKLIMFHTRITLTECFIGLSIAFIISLVFATLMDRIAFINRTIYPLLVITQTIPTVAVAPLLVLWLGYNMAPKIVLITIQCFFPLTVNMLSGFSNVDKDAINLMKTIGATKNQIYRLLKLPNSVPYIFSGLKIAASYSVITSVVAEWLGGTVGLGVYMTRVRKSFAFDKMFAVIFFVSGLSLLLMKTISILEKRIIKK